MPFCPECGNTVGGDQPFCAFCGVEQRVGLDPSESKDTQGTFATWGNRAFGYLIDQSIVLLLLIGLSLAHLLILLRPALLVEVWFVYQLGTTGQTPGMRVVGIQCLDADTGHTLGFLTALVRFFAHFFDSLVFFFGWLMPLWDKQGQTIADKLTNAIVIDVEKKKFSFR